MPRYIIYHADRETDKEWPSDYYLAGIIEADNMNEAVRKSTVRNWWIGTPSPTEPTWPRYKVQRTTQVCDVVMDEERRFWKIIDTGRTGLCRYERINYKPFYKVPYCMVTHDELRRKGVIGRYQEMLDDPEKVAEIGQELVIDLDLKDGLLESEENKGSSITVWKPYPAYGVLVVCFAKNMKEAEWIRDQN
jgi:hypothetical protein